MKIALIIIGILAVLITLLYIYYGGLVKITVTEVECGGEMLVYENVTGDYRQSGKVSDKVYKTLLEKHNVTTYKGFGIYYDNPKEVAKDKLRSKVGCILESSSLDKLANIQSDLKTEEYPKKNYITTEFPFKGMPSIILGTFKVYPALDKYSKSNSYSSATPVMEIWDMPNKKTVYRKEIVKE